MRKKEALVIGAGVLGLSTAIQLQDADYQVAIWSKDRPSETTSATAAAVWYPYLCAPKEKALVWAQTTFNYLTQHMLAVPRSGCQLRTMQQIFTTPQPEPWWEEALPNGYQRLTATDLPAGFVDGFQIETIVIDTSLYLSYLLHIFKDQGGILLQRVLETLDDAVAACQLVINCTGLGSLKLCNDHELYPVRGQMLQAEPTNLDRVMVYTNEEELSLVVPRVNDLMIGGTSQKNNWQETPSPEDTRAILRRVTKTWPELSGTINVLDEVVGLRPARSQVRLEHEPSEAGHLIHNYGHGGSGFTLSWGCAADVANIAEDIFISELPK